VAETQFDVNYTRSALYWLAQPLFFTGFRVDYAPIDQLDVKAFLTNGWNNTVDLNQGKSGGIQVTARPNDKISIAAGYMLGSEQADATVATMTMPTMDVPGANQHLRHFFDLVVDVNPTDTFRVLLNGSFGLENDASGQIGASAPGTQTVRWGGVNLALRYAPTEKLFVALRGEFYKDPNGFTTVTGQDVTLEDGTLTLGWNPTANLLFKLDQRVDHATQASGGPGLYLRGVADHSSIQVTTTLGVVATTNGW
jgi:hypothetical protein